LQQTSSSTRPTTHQGNPSLSIHCTIGTLASTQRFLFNMTNPTSTKAPKNRGDYESIPDVEEAVVIGDEAPDDDDDDDDENDLPRELPSPKGDPKALYPQANELEAQCLGYLDEVIALPTPQVKLPCLQVKHLTGKAAAAGAVDGTWWSSLMELMTSLQLPTAVFVASVTVATIVFVTSWLWLQRLFPYLACMAGFAAMVPSLMGRFTKQSNRAFAVIDRTQGNINTKVDQVTKLVEHYVDQIQDMVNKVLEPIRPKLDKMTKAEVIINKLLEPDVDIPDPKDIEQQLEGCADAIQDKMDLVKTTIQFTPYIPIYLRSKEDLNKYVIYPTLAVFLVLQLVSVYQSASTSRSNESHDMPEEDEFISGARYLLDTSLNQANETLTELLSRHNNITNTSDILLVPPIFSNAITEPPIAEDTVCWYYPFWVSIQVYMTTMVQLVVVFLGTEAVVLVAVLNTMISGVNDDANRALEATGAAAVFETYLTDKMTSVKDQLLNLITKLNTIEKALEVAGIDLDELDAMAGIKNLDDFKGAAKAKFDKLLSGKGKQAMTEKLDKVKDKVHAKVDAAKEKLEDTKEKLTSVKDKFGSLGKKWGKR
jgi:hypothetical protein